MPVLWKRLDLATTPKLTRFIPHRPTPKQAAFLLLNCLEAFYGGAAGGGKSDALLMAALQYVDVPGYSAILFRRTYADLSLPKALLDRAREWLSGTDAVWHDQRKEWTFPSGAQLVFGYLENDKDMYRYQSAEFQFVGFDELTQFSERQYRYLFSRLRRLKNAPVPLRMRGASNPGGIGHAWCKQRLIIEGRSAGRVFIGARLTDNPYLDQDEYRKSLANLDPVTQAQLLRGDWDIAEGGAVLRREWFEIVSESPRAALRVRYWDRAATRPGKGRDPDYTIGALLAMKDGMYWIENIQRFRGTPADNEARILQAAQMDGRGVPVVMEQEPGSSGVDTIDHYRRRVLAGYNFNADRVTGSKAERAGPLSSAAYAGNVKLVRGEWIGDLLDEAEAFPNGEHDDQIDAISGAMKYLTDRAAPAASVSVARATPHAQKPRSSWQR
jgi:predicted phage terminase large subunit-like protein